MMQIDIFLTVQRRFFLSIGELTLTGAFGPPIDCPRNAGGLLVTGSGTPKNGSSLAGSYVAVDSRVRRIQERQAWDGSIAGDQIALRTVSGLVALIRWMP